MAFTGAYKSCGSSDVCMGTYRQVDLMVHVEIPHSGIFLREISHVQAHTRGMEAAKNVWAITGKITAYKGGKKACTGTYKTFRGTKVRMCMQVYGLFKHAQAEVLLVQACTGKSMACSSMYRQK